MVDRNLLREFDVSEDELTALVTGEDGSEHSRPVPGRRPELRDRPHRLGQGGRGRRRPGGRGRRLQVRGPGPAQRVGGRAAARSRATSVEVLLEGMEDETGEIVLSRKKAHRMRAWEMVISRYHEGDVVKGTRHPQDQGRPAGRYRRQRLPARQPGRHPPPVRHRRLHRSRDRVHDPQDRREPAQHRRQPPQADRDHPRDSRRSNCSRRSASARSARGPSRTSPTSAPSSTWAASTACCTSPT